MSRIKVWLHYIRLHLTKTLGLIGAGFGYAQQNFESVKDWIPPRHRGLALSIFGTVIFFVGLWNTLSPPSPFTKDDDK